MRIINSRTVQKLFEKRKNVIEGYLYKSRTPDKKFKRRYFILSSNLLICLTSKNENVPRSVFILEGHIVDMCDDVTIVIKSPNCEGSDTEYYLRGSSSDEILQWMQKISQCSIDFHRCALEALESQYNVYGVVRKATEVWYGDNEHSSDIHERLNILNMEDLTDLKLQLLSGMSDTNVQQTKRENPFNGVTLRPDHVHQQNNAAVSTIVNPFNKNLSAFNNMERSTTETGAISVADKHDTAPQHPGIQHVNYLLNMSLDQLHTSCRGYFTEVRNMPELIDD